MPGQIHVACMVYGQKYAGVIEMTENWGDVGWMKVFSRLLVWKSLGGQTDKDSQLALNK